MNNLTATSEREIFRPADSLFPHSDQPQAFWILKERYPSFIKEDWNWFDWHSLCRDKKISPRIFLKIVQGQECHLEKQLSTRIADAFGFTREELFPCDIYPWLYSNDYYPSCPTYPIHARGEVCPEQAAAEDTCETSVKRRVPRRDKHRMSRSWTRARTRLERAEKIQDVEDAKRRYEDACIALVSEIISEYDREGISEEEMLQEGMCALQEANRAYYKDFHTLKRVTYVRIAIRKRYQELIDEMQRRAHLGARSLERDVLAESPIETEHPLAEAFSDEYAADARLHHVIEDTSSDEPFEVLMSKTFSRRIERVLNTLSHREREMVKNRFGIPDGYDYTLEEIGLIFGVSIEHVRQIIAHALHKLRQPYRERELKDFLPEGFKNSLHGREMLDSVSRSKQKQTTP